MNKKLQRIIVIILAAALLLTVLLPAATLFAKASVTQSDINNIKGKLNDVSQRKKDIQTQLAAVRSDLAKAKEAVSLVQEQVVLTEQQIDYQQQLIDETQAQIDAYNEQIAQKTADIHDLEVQEEEQYQEFYDQVRWMEETGSVSYLSILFEASSFAEMLDYATLIADIMDYANRIIDRLEATQAKLAEARAALQEDRDAQAEVKLQQEAQMDELAAQKAQLERDKAEAVALMNQIAASESEYAKEAADLAAEEAAIQKALKDAERKYAEQLAAMQNNGEWYWPLPGKTSLSSLFGGRYHPITHKWHSHTGTDIPAPGGTQIHAAQDGIVTYVSPNKNGSYGWYCMISHASGYVTLYAHQKVKPIVSEGQTVKKGQVIGYVGSTGSSTGNHLHFELRVNSVRKDALSLYPNMTFTYSGYSWKGNKYPSSLR